jgi:excisionase family DNA binding protein
MSVDHDPLLTTAEVAKRLHCSTKHVRALVARGDLKAVHLLGRTGTRGLTRVRPADLDALLDASRVQS